MRTRLVPLHFTESEQGHLTSYRSGHIIQLTQNIKGYKRGEQLQVIAPTETGELLVSKGNKEETSKLSLKHSRHFEIYQPKSITLAKGDRIRITRNSYSKYGRNRLNNGAEYTIDRINQHGDLILNNGYQLDKGFNHLNYAYVSTSYASQSKTVDQVLIAQSQVSFGKASSKEQFYVSVSRGRRGVTIYTDDVHGLKKELTKTNERLTATELTKKKAPESEWYDQVKKSTARYLQAVRPANPSVARHLNQPTRNA